MNSFTLLQLLGVLTYVLAGAVHSVKILILIFFCLPMLLKEYEVYSSEAPVKGKASAQVFRSVVFSENEMKARSEVFGMLRRKHKIKSTGAVVLKIKEVPQYSDVKVRYFKVSGAYRSKTKMHNVIKEIAEITKARAVAKFYSELRSRHSALPSCVTIVGAEEIEKSEVTSKDILQVLEDPKYPLFDKRMPSTAPNFQLTTLDRE